MKKEIRIVIGEKEIGNIAKGARFISSVQDSDADELAREIVYGLGEDLEKERQKQIESGEIQQGIPLVGYIKVYPGTRVTGFILATAGYCGEFNLHDEKNKRTGLNLFFYFFISLRAFLVC